MGGNGNCGLRLHLYPGSLCRPIFITDHNRERDRTRDILHIDVVNWVSFKRMKTRDIGESFQFCEYVA